MNEIKDVPAYIGSFPMPMRKLLKQMRQTIKKAAPKAQEKISWRMPGYFENGILVFFAGQKKHIGFYALPGAIKKFKPELKGYKVTKGGIQLPLDRPLPLKLVEKIVKFRVKENREKLLSR